VLEAASRLDRGAWAGQIAAGIVDRVYRELDAREIATPAHPTPGVAREYWPLDLDSWASCEGYGWGANTATMLMRQVFGFWEGPDEEGDDLQPSAPGWRVGRLRFHLKPNLPAHLLEVGRVYRVANMPYQGVQLNIGYRVESVPEDGSPAMLMALIAVDIPTGWFASSNGTRIGADAVAAEHARPVRNGDTLAVSLLPPTPA
jgi:hypothetical protein